MISLTRLDNVGFLAVTGKDAQKFLQGYVTCDIQDVAGQHASVGAICNLQGRMVTSFLIVATDDGFLLRMDQTLVPITMGFLKKYIVFSKAEMHDVSDDYHCFGVIGEVTGFPVLPCGTSRQDDDTYVVRVSDDARFEAWSPEPDWLVAGAVTAEPQEWRLREIRAGIAWVTEQTSQEFIPQMFGYHNIGGVDFDKGCYLGQEIVARMQYRGALSRKLFLGQGGYRTIGDALQDSHGKTVGTVVAAVDDWFLAVIQIKDDAVPEIQGCTLRIAHHKSERQGASP